MNNDLTDDEKVKITYADSDYLLPTKGSGRYQIALLSYDEILNGKYKCSDEEFARAVQLNTAVNSTCPNKEEGLAARQLIIPLIHELRSREDG